MSLSSFWDAVLLSGPVSVALLVAVLISSFGSLVLEDALLKNGKKIGPVSLSLVAFVVLFMVVSVLAVGTALGSIQNEGQAELASFAGLGVFMDSFWVFFLVQTFLLAGRAYWYKK